MKKTIPLLVLVVSVTSTAVADPFTWVEEWSIGDLPAYGQTSIPLVSLTPAALAKTLPWAEHVRFGTLVFHETEEVKSNVLVALHQPPGETGELVVDSNADGALAQDERAQVAEAAERPPGFGKPGGAVWLIEITKPHRRLAAFRLSPIGGLITCALRGYARGPLPVEGGALDAILVDANANMRLDQGADRLYLDENRDGVFDPATERRALPPRLDLATAAFTFSDGGPAHQAQWYLAPTGEVPVRCTIAGLKSAPTKLIACLSRVGGGLYQIASTDSTTKLPAGAYNVESVFLKLPATDGEVWTYTFDRQAAGTPTDVQGDAPVTLELLGKLSLAVSFQGKPTPGATLYVEVNARSGSGVSMTGCTKGQLNIGSMGSIPARLALLGPTGAKPVYESSMGFG